MALRRQPGFRKVNNRWGAFSALQQAQRGADDAQLLGSVAWRAQVAAQRKMRDEHARHLQGDGLMAKRFDIDAHRCNADRFQGACDVPNGHVADGSARSQQNGINAFLEHILCPLRSEDIAQAWHVGQAMKRIGVGGQFANFTCCC